MYVQNVAKRIILVIATLETTRIMRVFTKQPAMGERRHGKTTATIAAILWQIQRRLVPEDRTPEIACGFQSKHIIPMR